MAWARDAALGAAALLTSPLWGYRMVRTGKWRTDWRGRFGRGHPVSPDPRPTLLLHGVSVGEINATRALVRELEADAENPLRVVVSATTDTGFARAQELYAAANEVVRYPFDFGPSVRRFLDRVRPDVVALMELEVWPALVEECSARGIPVAVVSGRLSERSFRRYAPVRRWVEPWFRQVAAVGAQTDLYARRFVALGVPPERVSVTDTMKWDTAPLADEVDGAEALAERLGIDRSRPLVVAGSTGPGEEEVLLRERPHGVQLLLVPRKPERFEEVASLDASLVRWSQCGVDGRPPGTETSDVLLLDAMGELTRAYSLADAVVVGRSFTDLGGSDPIEPVALGKPTVIGPHHANFQDVVTALGEAGGIRVAEEAWPQVSALLADAEESRCIAEKGREVIRARRGATRRTADMVLKLIAETRAR